MTTPRMHKTFISAAAALALSGQLYSVTVNTLSDERDTCSSGGCSLWEAINETADGGTVDFSVTLPGTINLTSGSLTISKNITISGPISNDLTITGTSGIMTVSAGYTAQLSNLLFSGMNYLNAFNVTAGGTLNFNECNLSNNVDTYLVSNQGSVTISNSAITDNNTSVIVNSGNLSISQSVVSNNTGSYSTGSGPIYSNSGSVTISASTFENNKGFSQGGTITNLSPSVMSITDSVITGSLSSFEGGAINNSGTLAIASTLITDNNSSSNGGGAIYQSTGSLTISQSQISTNNAQNGSGGAIYMIDGNISIQSSVVSGNTASSFTGNSGGAIEGLGGSLSITGSEISGNESYAAGGGIDFKYGTVAVSQSVIKRNTIIGAETSGGGGAYFYSASFSVVESNITGNIAPYAGGGIMAYSGSGEIVASTISDNNSSNYGGGLHLEEATIAISQTTISDNNASVGGGISAIAPFSSPLSLNIVNSTISGNMASAGGGGIYFYTYYGNPQIDANITNTTIAYNSATNNGGGIQNLDAIISMKNTIIGSNSATTGPDCDTSSGMDPVQSAINTFGYNLIENNSSCSGFSLASNDILNTLPLLLSLADNGGPTWTHALDTISPARGTGSYYAIDGVTPVTTDQRGLTRPPALPSIGAYEPQAADISVSPASYDFGTLYISETSSEYNISITNIGESSIAIDHVYLENTTAEFGWTNYCSDLAPGASCNVGVTFQPTDSLPYLDYLNIGNSGTGIYSQVVLTGTGTDVPVPDIGVDTTDFNFGNVDIGYTANYTITVTNNGTADLTISSVSLQSGIQEFGITNSCTSAIATGGSCSIGISFTPSSQDSFSDLLQIVSNDPDLSTLTIPLYGYGYSSFELRFDEDITAAEYNAATALDPSLFIDQNMFELGVESYDGLRRGMIDVVAGTPLLLNFYDFNTTTKKYDTLKEENPFTLSSDYIMHFSDDAGNEAFNVKYVGSKPASDLNATIFGPNGTAYEFRYLQLLDEYRLEETQYDYSTSPEVAYTSINDFIVDHSSANGYFMEKEGSYNTGLIFNYTSGATSGSLSEVENGTVIDATAGSWQITTITSEVSGGFSGTALVVFPDDTASYHDEEFWAVESGILKRGYSQLADRSFRFHWFDYTAHNEFVSYFDGVLAGSTLTGTISLPSTYANDVTVTVFIDVMGSHDWISEQYTISAGQTQTSFSLLVPDGTKQFRVGYYVEDSVSGLVQRGYFSGTGTTAYEDEAFIYSSSSIPSLAAMTVLEGHTISGTVTLPTGFYAEDNDTRLDVVASVDVLGASALFRHQIRADVEFVAGENSVDFNLTIPDTDKSDRYFIAYDFFDGSDFIRQGYYSDSGMTPYFSDATAVDTSAGDVSGLAVNILDGITISGAATINATSSLPTYLFVRAMRDDGYEVFGGTEIPAGATSVTYGVDVPSTGATTHNYKLGYYVLQEDSPNIVDNTVIGYWNSAGTVTNKTEAGEFSVSSAGVANKNFTVADTDVQTVSVSAGWNLLSLPSKAEFSLFDMILHFGFRQDGIINMARYGSNGWSYYMVNGWEETVNRFNSLESGEGFWLQASKSFTLPFALADDADYADEIPELKTGWNLIGVNKDMSTAELAALYTAKGVTAIESIWTYKSGVWSVYIPDAGLDMLVSDLIPRLTNVTRFDGIWINLKGAE